MKKDNYSFISEMIKSLDSYAFDLTDEKTLQQDLFDIVLKDLGFVREFPLDGKNRIDFYHQNRKIGLEVKVDGSATAIHRQCKRYCKKNSVRDLVLLTSKSMGFPREIEGKPVYYHSFGKSWL